MASGIREGRSAFTVHGTPGQFVELVAEALPSDDGMIRVGVAHEIIGIDAAAVEREHGAILAKDYPHLDLAADDGGDDEDYYEAENRAYLKVFAEWLPALKFVSERDGGFRVDEIDIDEDSRLIGDGSSLGDFRVVLRVGVTWQGGHRCGSGSMGRSPASTSAAGFGWHAHDFVIPMV